MSNHHYDLSPSELRQYFRDFFSFVSRCLYFFAKTARRHYLVLLLITVLSFLLIGWILNKRPRVYDFRMSCVYNDNQARTFGELLAQLNFLLENKEYATLSAALHMREEQLKKLVSIEGRTVTLGVLENDFSGNKTPFFVDIKVEDPALAAVIEPQVLRYLNHNELSQRSVDQQKAKWKSRDEFYTAQLLKLDSLKEAIRLSYLSNNNDAELMQRGNAAVDVYKLSDSMSFYRADIRYYLEHYETVQKIYGFKLIHLQNPSSLRKKAVLYSLIIAILAWVLLAVKDMVYESGKATARPDTES
ncbi:hypothetical protein [Rurimicrobium arvi]|uniref:Chain length determinant protein n=1 Tax=Rurimicrobium arvi TaxID=2049916 RepID=A0ABP8N0W4_9BACT